MTNSWKITIPVLRAEEHMDGLYIVGEASGPERDTHGTEMSPEAVADFARQIRERVEAGDPIPYIDSHAKVGVLRELGHVMDGSVTHDMHLSISVRLDEANPAALFLHNNIKRGKQYGMSVGGDLESNKDYEVVRDEKTGKRVIRFLRVILREISNTTKPSWVPSFGTVLARSLEGELAEDEMSDELERETTTEEAAPAESEQPAAEVELSADAQTTEETEVERARIAKKDADALIGAFNALAEQLKALGLDTTPAPAEEAAPAPENTSVENSETGEEDLVEIGTVRVERSLAESLQAFVTSEVERQVAEVRAELETAKADITRSAETITSLEQLVSDKDAYIKTLEDMPAGRVPAPIVREKFEVDMPDLSGMSPEERLRWGLKGVYANR